MPPRAQPPGACGASGTSATNGLVSAEHGPRDSVLLCFCYFLVTTLLGQNLGLINSMTLKEYNDWGRSFKETDLQQRVWKAGVWR